MDEEARSGRDPTGPPVDVDALLAAAENLPFEGEAEDAETGAEGAPALPPAVAAALREALRTPVRGAPLPGEAHATLPCPDCGTLARIVLGDPPRAVRCERCGAAIDPAAPFDLPLVLAPEVIAHTEATLLVLLAARSGAVWWLGDAMRAALATGRGLFVLGRIDLDRDPDAPRQLGLERGPALAIYQGGERIGAFVFPEIGQAIGRVLGRAIGPWVTGAAAPGLGGIHPVLPAPEGETTGEGGHGAGAG